MITLMVNGEQRTVKVAPAERLLDVLRRELGLPGTKEGCGEGECGACAVLMDGVLVNSCLVPVIQAAGTRITTIEGIADPDRPTPLLRAFVECNGAQCGICTPGMMLAAQSLIQRNPRPSAGEVREAIAGNLCRCTGYTRIVEAVQKAAAELAGEGR